MKTTREIGNEIEEVVVRALQKRGFEIVERNVYTRFGELDIVARKEEIAGRHSRLHIIEVKFQSAVDFGGAHLALTAEKYTRMRKSAAELQSSGRLPGGAVQFDFVAVTRGKSGYEVTLFENISLADIQR